MDRAEMEQNDRDRLEKVAHAQPAFAQSLGVRIVSATPDRVEGEIDVRPEFGNRNGVMHGGALMAFADNMGGTTAFVNLDENQGTTTLESKTNFFRPVAVGEVLKAVCVPIHKGRKVIVCQTTLIRADGKTAAIVTQTQMVLEKRS